MLKLFITDIDGVWTDGSMYYDQIGNELKRFNTYDSAGVLFLKNLGIPTAIITGEDTHIVRRRAEKLGISRLFMGVKDKVSTAQSICTELGIDFKDVAYIGDDINDYHLLKLAGYSGCPANSPTYIKEIVDVVLSVKGGDGAFRAFVEKYLYDHGLFERALSQSLSLDAIKIFKQ